MRVKRATRIFLSAFALCLLLAAIVLPFSGPVEGATRIPIYVDDKGVEPDVPPVIVNGRLMVPLRFIAQAMGATVWWDEVAREVKVWSNPNKYNDAFNEGYQRGYADGRASASSTSNDNNYTRGWNEGYQAGYKDAQAQQISSNDQWYKKGYQDGYQVARTDDPPNMPGIYGDNTTKFVLRETLRFLYQRSPSKWYDFVTKWVKFIEIKNLSDASGMVTWGSAWHRLVYIDPAPHIYNVKQNTISEDALIWAAGLLVHEATHVRDYQEGRAPMEINALEMQKAALKELGAPKEWINSLTEEELNHPWERILQDLFK